MVDHRQSRKLAAEVEGLAETAVRRVQIRFFQTVTSANPVLTGFSRAGWSPSIARPDRSGPKRAPDDEELATSQAAALFAKHSGVSQAIASGYRLKQGPVYVVNNVVYIERLNEGWSGQAPAMFVEEALQVAVRATQREIRSR